MEKKKIATPGAKKPAFPKSMSRNAATSAMSQMMTRKVSRTQQMKEQTNKGAKKR